MKKSLTAAVVVFFTFIGASALASMLDFNVKRNVIETTDQAGGSNGTGGRNQITREK
ncbi:MAG: hypothetical protein ACXVCE_10380 [Bacteriovorax sp.]